MRIHRNPVNLGYARNFVQAIQLCSGNVIALSDQDDIWYDDKLVRLEELFEQNPQAGGIFTNGDLINADSEKMTGDLWSSFSFDKNSRRRILDGDSVAVLLRRNVVTGMAFAFRSEWRRRFSHMPPHWPHDSWLALMLASESCLLPREEHLVAYRVHQVQQIGIPINRAEKIRLLRSGKVGHYLALSRERNLREYQKHATQYEALLEKAQHDPMLAGLPWLSMAEAKARHMRYGATHLQTSCGYRRLSVLAHWNDYRLYAPTGMKAL